jgi:DNA primase
MSVIDEVKERIDILDVVGESVKLRKSGKNYMGFCPFHANTRTPAFAVFPDSGTWRCFGACNEGGDVFSFLMKKEGWDFAETLRYLADRAGIELEPQTPAQQEAEEAYERLRTILESASVFFRHSLHNTAAGEKVLEYLLGRGLSRETLERFEIGMAPEGWENSISYLKEKGFEDKELLDAGVASERESGGIFDRFRNRIMIPIRDSRGRMAGFGARVIDPEDVPKYLNSPQTAVFDKGRLLYGLDKARKAIRMQDQAIIVEGYMDVIGLHQAGFENAVSPMGTAVSENQLRTLKRYSRRIVLAMDADLAGSQATLRGLSVAREALDREPDPVFDARGLVRHEGRLDAEIRVLTLPEGIDPDEVVAENPEEWHALLDRAQTVVEYVLDVMTKDRDLDDPKAKAEIARQVLPLIEDVADPVEREAYRQMLARHLRVDERALMQWQPKEMQRRRRVTRTRAESAEPLPDVRRDSPLEGFCLGVLLSDPELLYRIDRQLQMAELTRLEAKDFSSSENQAIFEALRSALSQDDMEPVEHWRSKLEATLLEKAEVLLASVEGLDMSQANVLEAVVGHFMQLRKRNLDVQLNQLRFQLQAVQDAEDQDGVEEDLWNYTRRVQDIATQKDRLDRAIKRGASQIMLMTQGR